ncbi:UNVERIFIED_CONTAM: hypothetical protein K2H54_060407 [Gekko kuhli]
MCSNSLCGFNMHFFFILYNSVALNEASTHFYISHSKCKLSWSSSGFISFSAIAICSSITFLFYLLFRFISRLAYYWPTAGQKTPKAHRVLGAGNPISSIHPGGQLKTVFNSSIAANIC